ncbi:MAG: ATP-binding protein [Chloroflexi bacterium]|nr:ATP-binding protein [Chloroflexota bacterium]
MLWWPRSISHDDESQVHAQFEGTLGLADAVFRIWQNNRRHERRYHRLKALEELSLAVASSLDLHDVLSKTRDAVVNALGFERTAIYVLDEDGHTLRGACATDDQGGSASISERAFDIRGSQHPVAKVARGECDFYVVDRSAASGYPGRAKGWSDVSRKEPGPASGLAPEGSTEASQNGAGDAETLTILESLGDPEAVVPLRAAGGVVGVIAISCGVRPVAMREEHLKVLLPFAAHAGAAVHNARMHEKLASQLRRTEELELQRSNFEREVILSVTEGKLSLCEAEEIPLLLGEPLASVALATAGDVARCRQVAVQAALRAGLNPDRKSDFELCLGEAATNCYQHAGGGVVEIYLKDERIQFRIRDSGPGIQSFVLPRAMLLKGYSTTTSLGMGFSLMLTLSDRLYLATSTVRGTDMLIEMAMEQTSEIERIWEQFGFLSDQAA